MTAEKPKISVIIAVQDQARDLEQNLPVFLNQQGEEEYEVIVVNDSSVDDSADVLDRMKAEYSHLYTTFLPFSKVPYPSRLRLALTIGAKAARGEWIVLANITRPPLSDTWIFTLIGNIDNSAEVILDYHSKTNIIQLFSSLEEAAPYIIKAERNSRYGHQGRLFLFRRGIYSTMMVKASRIHDAIKLFDQHIGSYQLTNLRMQVLSKNIFY
jgi:cellulose synthase/poly-beta-1,6-N-acetylglucosamine synthase-like glycosyltransferase